MSTVFSLLSLFFSVSGACSFFSVVLGLLCFSGETSPSVTMAITRLSNNNISAVSEPIIATLAGRCSSGGAKELSCHTQSKYCHISKYYRTLSFFDT